MEVGAATLVAMGDGGSHSKPFDDLGHGGGGGSIFPRYGKGSNVADLAQPIATPSRSPAEM
jgi:hypothetical protein